MCQLNTFTDPGELVTFINTNEIAKENCTIWCKDQVWYLFWWTLA